MLKNIEELKRENEFLKKELLKFSQDKKEFNSNEEIKYKSIFNNIQVGFALHEIIVDDNNNPIDYRFLEINPAFESITGLNSEDILGKRVLEVLPDIEKSWIEKYGRVALTGEQISFEEYQQQLDKYFIAFAFSPSKGQFAVLFNDITNRKQEEFILQKSD